MKWVLTFFVPLVFALLISFTGKSQDEFKNGVEAYNKKNYVEAVHQFEKVIAKNPNNTSAWYNLGLSNIGLKSFGEAIWSFEKVLKYTPNDNETEGKIAYCYNQLYPDQVWQPRLNSFESSLYGLSPNNWSIVSIVLSILTSILFILYFTRKHNSLRNIFLATAIFTTCCFISSIIISSKTVGYYSNESFAIVIKKSIPTYIDNTASIKTKITEGNRVEIIDQQNNGLVTIETTNGEQHIVRLKDLSII